MPSTVLSINRACVLAFAAGFTTLAFQVFAHRMVSVKLLNNLAFLVISLTMLGFAASGVLLTRWLKPILQRFHNAMSLCAALFAITTVLCSHMFYALETVSQKSAATRPSFILDLFRVLPLSMLYAIPFTFTGLILGAVLSDENLPSRKVYFADLAGSCLGAIFAIPAISLLGVERSALACCATLLLAAILTCRPTSNSVRGACGAAGLALMTGFAIPDRVFDMNYPAQSTLHSIVTSRNPNLRIEHIVWDPVARIELSNLGGSDVSLNMGYPCLIGDNREFHKTFRKILTQNNYAFTFAVQYDGKRESLKGIDRTIYAAAYSAKTVEKPRVVVIGVGGGFDILTGLYFDCASITGVEINAATLHILRVSDRDYFAPWVADPRVTLIHGEGRHYLASSRDKFDIIQLSGVDSYSGSSASAHVFSENFLYTQEAFDMYLSRMTPDGVLNMMRLEQSPPAEMLKALVTAIYALRRSGIAEPWRHIAMVTSKEWNFTALLVKKSPFKPEEMRRLAAWTSDNPHFKLSAGPGIDQPVGGNAYQAILAQKSIDSELQFLTNYPFDIAPCTDDRPFYFRHSFWWHLFPDKGWIWEIVPRGEYTLIILALLIGAACIFFVWVPLLILAGAKRQTGTARFGVIFACTAVAFMAIEIAMLQKFGLFLGHPNYALSIVLAALLLGTGLGALYSDRICAALKGQRFVAYAFCGLVLAEMLLIAPSLNSFVGLPFLVRAISAALLSAVPGLLMGTFVPIALTHLKKSAPAFVPWAWGVNGIVSVLAPVLSVAFAMTFGAQMLAICALPFYLLAGWLYPVEFEEPAQRVEAAPSAPAPAPAPETAPAPNAMV